MFMCDFKFLASFTVLSVYGLWLGYYARANRRHYAVPRYFCLSVCLSHAPGSKIVHFETNWKPHA